MKKLILVFTFFVGLSNLFAEENKIKVASINYSPYYGPDLENGGAFVEIVREAFKTQGVSVKFSFLQWSGALMRTKHGNFDAILALWHRKDREQDFLYSDGFLPNKVVFYARDSFTKAIKSMKNMRGLKVGTIKNYTYPEKFKEASYFHKSEAVSMVQSLKKLMNKRVDVIIGDKGLVAHTCATNFSSEECSKLKQVGPIIRENDNHLGVSKKSPRAEKIRKWFNDGLKKIKDDGLVNKIIKKHNLAF